MNLLVLSPDFASHYGPLSVVASAARRQGHRVVVGVGPALQQRAADDGFETRTLQLGAGSNDGMRVDSDAITRFIQATTRGAVATLHHQALEREKDLLWRPEQVARRIVELVDEVRPDQILVDHVSFASTLGAVATGRDFVTLVPGHPTQLPVGTERYGVPPSWPALMTPTPEGQAALDALADRVADTFTERWNVALGRVDPRRSAVEDAFRVHGSRVLFNSDPLHHDSTRTAHLPAGHRFVGPLVRREPRPPHLDQWADRSDGRPRVYVALGTFLSRRGDVLTRVAAALKELDVVAAVATGPTSRERLGALPSGWIVSPHLPQVALLADSDLAITHGGNNSTQEARAAGTRQIVLPFSTDQFAVAADVERCGSGTVCDPNTSTPDDLATAIVAELSKPPLRRLPPPTDDELTGALFS